MHRFFVPPEQCRDDVFELPEREGRHAAQVLRLGPSDGLTVLDGAGSILTCQMDSARKHTVRVSVRERRFRPPLPCAITLIQAIPKGPAFESIVQKATELGAARIIPLLSERVVVHFGAKDASAKLEKWRQIAIESIKQCGSPWLPVIENPARFETAIAARATASGSPPPDGLREARSESHSGSAASADISVVCSLQETRRTLRDAVAGFTAVHGRRPSSAVIWIGPEGDFTPDEYAAIAKTGASPITLGPLVLRADTAAIACLAVAHHELQPRD